MEMEDGDMFEDEKLELRLNMARSCLQQNNFHLTLRILKETFPVSVACSLQCASTVSHSDSITASFKKSFFMSVGLFVFFVFFVGFFFLFPSHMYVCP